MGKTSKYKALVEKFINEAKAVLPKSNDLLCGEGKIYYQNGNDGTRFDWNVNDMLCEFMLFYKKSEMGYVKLVCSKNGTFTTYTYDEDGKYMYTPYAQRKTYKVLTPGGMQAFYRKMCAIADKKELYDIPIDELAW